jgi:UDP-2-acetamido-3-amino-2,3-dideoxy-glucuronate N-acetyltransferase
VTHKEKCIGLAGLGYWGKNILRNLHDFGVLHTACDTSSTSLAEYKQKFPHAQYVDSFDEILKNPEIKAVAISTPAVTHYEMVKKALRAGKDVYVEKPLALTVKEGSELVDIAEKEARILMVGHILQYHPAIIELKELISSGELGKIQYLYSNRLNIGKLRTEENILWSFAPHDISVILMLLEEEPVNVKTFAGDYLSKGIYDTTLTTLDFKNGVKGHIFVSWLHPFKEQKLIVVGSKAMAVFDDLSKEKLFIFRHQIEWENGKIPVAHKADYQVVPVQSKEPLQEELRHFIECILERRTPKTDGSEGLKVLRILESAEKGLTDGKNQKADCRAPHYFLHESACVDENVRIGEGCKIWHFSHILKGSSIGNNSIIAQNVTIGPDVTIGNKCKIQNNVSIYKGVTLEEEVFCGPSCVFTNVYNPRAFIERKHEFRKTHIKRGATIGANATIVCGVTIGKYAMIGAGSVVKSDVADYGIVAGVPAQQIGWTCKCGTTLKFKTDMVVCGYCGNKYEKKSDRLVIIEEEGQPHGTRADA